MRETSIRGLREILRVLEVCGIAALLESSVDSGGIERPLATRPVARSSFVRLVFALEPEKFPAQTVDFGLYYGLFEWQGLSH